MCFPWTNPDFLPEDHPAGSEVEAQVVTQSAGESSRSAVYRIVVENPAKVERGVKTVSLDGTEQADGVVPLAVEGMHEVRVVLG
jgi:hypothetical protein